MRPLNTKMWVRADDRLDAYFWRVRVAVAGNAADVSVI
jgi:hypothetical protein